MKMDNLRRYIDLRNSLAQEKSRLEQRLQQIDQALEHSQTVLATVQTFSGGRRGRPVSGALSLRDAVIQATSRRPMTKEEILQAVRALGYRFSTNNPMNSLGVILYGKNPRFKNESGRFSIADANPPSSIGHAFTRKKHRLSPAARERIAAAQRARWAKARRN